MELFTESKNKIYSCIADIINLAFLNMGKIDKSEVSYLLKSECNEFLWFEDYLLNSEEATNMSILKKHDATSYELNVNSNVSYAPITAEKIWLKHILSDPKIELFLPDITIGKLSAALKDVDDIMSSAYIKSKKYYNCAQAKNFDLTNNFKSILYAIMNSKSISFSYKTRDEKTIENNSVFPYKIEYSIRDDLFYLISYSLHDNKAVKNLIEKISDISFYDVSPKDSKFYKKCCADALSKLKAPEPIVLEIKNERNALERAFYAFSFFERESEFIKESDVHRLYIYYYKYEKSEIISRILSLGKSVLVISPDYIVYDIVSRIKRAIG